MKLCDCAQTTWTERERERDISLKNMYILCHPITHILTDDGLQILDQPAVKNNILKHVVAKEYMRRVISHAEAITADKGRGTQQVGKNEKIRLTT